MGFIWVREGVRGSGGLPGRIRNILDLGPGRKMLSGLKSLCFSEPRRMNRFLMSAGLLLCLLLSLLTLAFQFCLVSATLYLCTKEYRFPEQFSSSHQSQFWRQMLSLHTATLFSDELITFVLGVVMILQLS